MRKLIPLLMLALLTCSIAMAVPAKPGLKKTVTQSDGTTITVGLVGDEWHHSLVTSDGKPVARVANGDLVYRTADGVSTVIAHEKAQRTAAEKTFLEQNQDAMTADAIIAKSGRAKTRAASGRRKAAGNPQVPQTGSPKIPIILVQYKDVSFVNSKSTFETQYTSTTSKSAYKYFNDQSNGQYTPQFDVYGPYKLSGNRSTYGGNDSDGNDVGVAKMVGEAIDVAGSDINWANYDNDSDGEADVCIVVYAGGGEAQTSVDEQIWPCQWNLASGKSYGDGTGARTRNGKKIDKFAVFNELNGTSATKIDGVGTFCHEYGHCMGLPDFYETTYDNGYYGMGNWDIMCGGSYNDDGYTPVGYNSYEKNFMGWLTPTTPQENTNYILPVFNNGNDMAVKVTSPLNSNEYYLLENRAKQGWDAYIKDEGMMVLHVTYVASRWTANTPNNEAVQLFTIIPADNKLSESNETKDLFGETNHALTDETTPAATLNMTSSGSVTGSAGYMGKPLTEIYLNSDKTVSFWYMKGTTTPLGTPTLNEATAPGTDRFTASWSAVANAGSYELQIDPTGTGGGGTGGGGTTGGSQYVKVTSAGELPSGDYLIVYEDGSKAFDGGLNTLDATNNYISVTIDNGAIEANSTTNAAKFTYDATDKTLKSASGYYIGNTANTNKIETSNSTAYTNTITIDGSGNATIKGSGGAFLRYNSASDQNRFRYFKSSSYTTQQPIQLYKLSGSASAPRKAAATSQTITGITATSYTVTGLKDNTTYALKVRAVPTTTDSEHSTGNWSTVKSVTTTYDASLHTPMMLADETAAVSAYVNQQGTVDVTVLYEDLTADITANITGANYAMFSCPETITRDSSGEGEAALTITYQPTAAGTHTATLTLTSTGADPVTVTLTGTATLAPIATSTPVMQTASAVTASGFTATWTDNTPAEAVESYTLYVNKQPEISGYVYTKVTDAGTLAQGDQVIFVDETAQAAAGGFGSNNYMSSVAVNISNDQIVPGDDVNVFTISASGDGWKFLSSLNGEYLKTDVAKKMTTDETGTAAKVSIVGGDATIEFYPYGRILYNATSPRFLNYTSNTSNSMRLPQLYRRTAVSGNAPAKASETGDADDDGLTVTGITAKTYNVTGLTAGATYDFKVKAIYTARASAAESSWSNLESVTLLESANPKLTLSQTALAFTATNNTTDSKTFTVTGQNLTGDVSVEVTGEGAAMFSVSPATIAVADANGAIVTVTYTPTAAGNHTATITVSSSGAESKTVTLTGTASLAKGTLTLNEASNVGSTQFTASWTDTTTPASNVSSYTLYVNKQPEVTEIYDVLTRSVTGVAAGTSYETWSNKSVNSSAVYAGNSAGVSNTIQLRSNNSNSGIVTTASGGKIRKVTVVWQSSTANGRTLNVYGKNSAYSAATDLYSSNSQGTLLGTIVKGTSTELEISDDYAFVGVRSKDGAMYLNSITFTWEGTSAGAPRRTPNPQGDADNGGLTVTGITEKSYTVTGLTAGATYDFKVKAVYADDSQGDWTEPKHVTLEESSDPRISVSASSLEFAQTNVGGTATQTLTVTAANLTQSVTVGVTGEGFSVSPATLTAAEANGATITVTYSPTAAGNHSGTVTLSSSEIAASVEVSLTGSAVYQKSVPQMQPAANVGMSSFKAVWTDATNAAAVTDYTLYVNKVPDEPDVLTPILSETFGKKSPIATDGTSDIGNELDEYTDVAGWTGSAVYHGTGYSLKLGSSNYAGTLTTPPLDLSNSNGKVTVKFIGKYYGKDVSSVVLSSGDNNSLTQSLASDARTYVLVLNCTAAANQTITFEGTAKSKRFYLYNVQVYLGDVSSEVNAAPHRLPAESGSADSTDGLTVTGITDKEYSVMELTAGATYTFSVKANYADGTTSELSNTEEVTLNAGGNTLAQVLDSELGDYSVTDNLAIVASVPESSLYYATNGTDWIPIHSTKSLTTNQVITNVDGEFNGSATAPEFELAGAKTCEETVDFTISTLYLGNDFNNIPVEWDELPVAGQVVDLVGYLFFEGDVATLRGYSTQQGRRLVLKTDHVNLTNTTKQYLKVRACIELNEQWSGAPRRRIGAGDENAYTNLRAQLISVQDVLTGVDDLTVARTPVKVTYYNVAGMASDEPFSGVNIVVTTYADGTTETVKQMR